MIEIGQIFSNGMTAAYMRVDQGSLKSDHGGIDRNLYVELHDPLDGNNRLSVLTGPRGISEHDTMMDLSIVVHDRGRGLPLPGSLMCTSGTIGGDANGVALCLSSMQLARAACFLLDKGVTYGLQLITDGRRRAGTIQTFPRLIRPMITESTMTLRAIERPEEAGEEVTEEEPEEFLAEQDRERDAEREQF